MTWVFAFLIQERIDFRTELAEAMEEARRKKRCVLIVFFQPG